MKLLNCMVVSGVIGQIWQVVLSRSTSCFRGRVKFTIRWLSLSTIWATASLWERCCLPSRFSWGSGNAPVCLCVHLSKDMSLAVRTAEGLSFSSWFRLKDHLCASSQRKEHRDTPWWTVRVMQVTVPWRRLNKAMISFHHLDSPLQWCSHKASYQLTNPAHSHGGHLPNHKGAFRGSHDSSSTENNPCECNLMLQHGDKKISKEQRSMRIKCNIVVKRVRYMPQKILNQFSARKHLNSRW